MYLAYPSGKEPDKRRQNCHYCSISQSLWQQQQQNLWPFPAFLLLSSSSAPFTGSEKQSLRGFITTQRKVMGYGIRCNFDTDGKGFLLEVDKMDERGKSERSGCCARFKHTSPVSGFQDVFYLSRSKSCSINKLYFC